MQFKLVTTKVVAAMLGLAASALAAEKDIPAWHKADPGTHALLGDDGGGADTATVCDTADQYRDWLDDKHPPGCQAFQHDLSVVIETVTFDRTKDAEHFHGGALGLPIAKVYIPSKRLVGYIHLEELHPIIPAGTIIHFDKLGNETFELHPRAKIGGHGEHGTLLGEHVAAKVISYDPSKDDEWDLHVTILDGEHAGQSGWMLSTVAADADDGHPVFQFSDAMNSIPAGEEAFNCSDYSPHSGAYESGKFDAAFKEIQPLANERCPEAEHLLGVMYALGRRVQKDFVHAYALLLLAYSDGMTPVGKTAFIPVLGDDESVLEIVQFGAQLTPDQLDSAETLAKRLAQTKGKLANPETAGPAEVSNSIRELRPRVAGYKLNGELATIELTRVGASLSQGMSAVAPDHVLTQIVTENNAKMIPMPLVFAEMKLRAVGHGMAYESKSEIDELGASQGERFAWLGSGTRVRVVKYAVNGGFAAQVEQLDERNSESDRQRYWVDHCLLTMESEADRALWETADAGYCEAHGF